MCQLKPQHCAPTPATLPLAHENLHPEITTLTWSCVTPNSCLRRLMRLCQHQIRLKTKCSAGGVRTCSWWRCQCLRSIPSENAKQGSEAGVMECRRARRQHEWQRVNWPSGTYWSVNSMLSSMPSLWNRDRQCDTTKSQAGKWEGLEHSLFHRGLIDKQTWGLEEWMTLLSEQARRSWGMKEEIRHTPEPCRHRLSHSTHSRTHFPRVAYLDFIRNRH